MANTVTALKKEQYTKMVQALLEERLIAMDLANVRRISNWDTLNNPRGVYMNVDSYTKYTDVTDSDITYSNETLTINQTPIISFVYDPVDALNSGYDIIGTEASKVAYRIKIDIEGNFFNEYSNADNTNAAAVTLSTSNVVSTYGDAYATLVNNGVDSDNICAVIDPFQLQMIGQWALGNTFNVADSSYKRGYKGEFQNMKIYVSTNLTATADLTPADNFTADETVTINGVTFTFKATPSASGEVDIWADTATSLDNLVAAINNANGYAAGAGSATAYFEVSAANRAKLEWLTATDGTTKLTLTSKRWYKVLSSSSSEWGAITIHNIIMEKWAIDMGLQKEVSMKTQDIHKQLGTRYMTWCRYGLKTFSQWAERMYDLKIVAAAAES